MWLPTTKSALSTNTLKNVSKSLNLPITIEAQNRNRMLWSRKTKG